MRTRIALASAAAVVAASSWVPTAHGQFPGILSGRNKPAPASTVTATAAPAPAPSAAAVDKRVVPAGTEIVSPEFADEKLGVPLPTSPIEPYLLTKDNGPFMVLAYTFRGPEAPRKALAVVLELRNKYNLPAYVLLSKDFPGRSNIRNVPPQAELAQKVPAIGNPEAVRTLDEAAVMVGNEKTVEDSTKLLKRVKSLHLACFNDNSNNPLRKGRGLARAIRTTNPFVPAELLFAQKPDLMLVQMNGGPHNIANCPGRYALQVAEFSGRSSFDPDSDTKFSLTSIKKSPLQTAADDAERMAEALSRDSEFRKICPQVWVYHDRYASRVLVGSFQGPADPSAKQVHDQLIATSGFLVKRKVIDSFIIPASNLTDLAPIKNALAKGSNAQARR